MKHNIQRIMKYVLLFVCLLGVVFQPVTIYADDTIYRNYSTAEYFVTGLVNTANTILSYSIDTDNLLSSSPSGFPSIDTIKAYLNNNNINWSGTLFNFTSNGSTKYVFVLSPGAATSYSSQYLYYASTSGARLTISNNTITAISISASMASNLQPIFAYNSNVGFPSSRYSVGYYINDSFSTTFYQTNQQYRFTFDSGYVADNTNSGGGSSGGSSSDLSTIETYLANLYLQNGLLISNNFRSYTPDGTPVNSSWVGVGQALTYDYLCKTNKDSSSVSVTLPNGTSVTLDNYLYGQPNYLSSLASINTALNTLNTHLTNKLDPIASDVGEFTDKFNELYPDDAVAMTTSIEDQIYDSNNGGIGLSDMQSTLGIKGDAETAFDTGVSLSQGISGLFGFTDSGEWGFWSSACQNDLDSVQGTLMDDSDVVDYSPYENKYSSFLERLGISNGE